MASMPDSELRDYAWVDSWMQLPDVGGLLDTAHPWVDSMRPGYIKGWNAYQWKCHFYWLSKDLSKMLRHAATQQGLAMRSDGGVLLTELLAHRWFQKYHMDDILVTCMPGHNVKNRFELIEDHGARYIRARQGHSSSIQAGSGISCFSVCSSVVAVCL